MDLDGRQAELSSFFWLWKSLNPFPQWLRLSSVSCGLRQDREDEATVKLK
jgi:hypothetical protein